MDYSLLIDGRWISGGTALEANNKYTGETIAALRAKTMMAALPAHKRADILMRTAALLRGSTRSPLPAARRSANISSALPGSRK